MSFIVGFILGAIISGSIVYFIYNRFRPLSADYDPERPYYVALNSKKEIAGYKEYKTEKEFKKSRTIREWQLSGFEVVSCSKETLSDYWSNRTG